jgi:4-amino-4-deoxy-L-arabinose transferase-like glycosyltransferase
MKTTSYALLVAFALTWFATAASRDLFNTDEARYAEIAREMVASGDWVTPRLNGYKYLEKPPLQYWATAAAFEAFGMSAWSARLWTALTGFAALLATLAAGTRLLGPAAGAAGALLLGTSLMWFGMGHFASLDAGLAAFLSCSIYAFALAQRDAASVRARRNWMLAAWACAALAVLSKGLIGVVLPGGALVLYALWQRDWRLLGARLHWGAGLAVFLVIAAPWFVAVSRANPEFARFFFIHEHFERFTTTEHGRYQPAWYFVPVLLLGLAPWTFALPGALAAGLRRDPLTQFQPRRFLLVWIVLVFAFFSASHSKLISYILPLFPALALLAGDWATRAPARALAWVAAPALAFGAVIAWLAPRLMGQRASPELPAGLLAQFLPWVVGAALALTFAGLISSFFALRDRRGAAIAWLAAGGLAAAFAVNSGYQALAPLYSARQIVERVRPQLDAAPRLFFYDTFDHSFLFYARRTATMVLYQDELSVPIGWQPRDFIASFESFSRAWQGSAGAVALMRPREYAALAARQLPMKVLARDPRRVVVARP